MYFITICHAVFVRFFLVVVFSIFGVNIFANINMPCSPLKFSSIDTSTKQFHFFYRFKETKSHNSGSPSCENQHQCPRIKDSHGRETSHWVQGPGLGWNGRGMKLLCIFSHARNSIFTLVIGTDWPGQTCRPRSDATECGIWSGPTLFATHPAVLRHSNR